MKKIILLIASVISLASCMPSAARLMNSATYSRSIATKPVAALFADITVSETKISYLYLPSKTVLAGGIDNVKATAVREALDANGGGDMLIALETQIKYDKKGKLESIKVTGYPARYSNFRSPGDEYLRTLKVEKNTSENAGGILSIFGGKK